MVSYVLAFVAGLSLLFQFSVLPTIWQVLLLATAAAACMVLLFGPAYLRAAKLVSGVVASVVVGPVSKIVSRVASKIVPRVVSSVVSGAPKRAETTHTETSCNRATCQRLHKGRYRPGIAGRTAAIGGLSARTRFFLTLLVATIAGFLYAWIYCYNQLQQRLPESLYDIDLIVTGRVSGMPERNGRRLRFLFHVSQAMPLAEPTSPRLKHSKQRFGTRHSLVRLNWYGGDAPGLRQGDQLQLQVKLRKPSGFMNPGGFDYEKWLFQSGIIATGYVRDTDLARMSWQEYRSQRRQSSDLAISPGRARAWLVDRMQQASGNLAQHGLIMALAVGERGDIEPDQWQRFIATGTNHLLAISGLHITLVATGVGLLFRLLWPRVRLLRRLPRQFVVICAAAVGAFVYAAMAGFSIPTQRALLMFMVLVAFTLKRRHQGRFAALSLALLLVCLWNPLSVLSAGFWMSFSAVAILYLVFASVPRQGVREKITAVLRGHFLITVGLYPITLLLFQQASIVAPLANFICVPVVGALITPAVFVCTVIAAFSVSAASVLLQPVDWLLSVVSAGLGVMAGWPLAMVRTGQVTATVLLLVTAAMIFALTPFKSRLRWLLVPLTAPLLFAVQERPNPGDYVVTFLDVGQGSAVVVHTSSRTLLFDTGARFSRSFSAAGAVIVPYLQSMRIDHLDSVVVSHSDSDHSGGLDEILQTLQVDELWWSQPVAVSARLPESHQFCHTGVSWIWDNVRFEFLHPGRGFDGSDNNLSCVLQITAAGGQRTLLTGDIEQEAEELLLSSLTATDILMVPHHGSLTSSGAAFVAATRASHVVYTVGHNNRFGFPKAEVVRRYQAIDAKQYRTSGSGAIRFSVRSSGIKVDRYRQQKQRFWTRPADDVSPMTATLD